MTTYVNDGCSYACPCQRLPRNLTAHFGDVQHGRIVRLRQKPWRAVAAFVEDSDYAYFVAGEAGRIVSRAIVDPDAATNYKQGRLALEHLDQSLADRSFHPFLELIAEWKGSRAPRLNDVDLRPEYAEDSVRFVGIPPRFRD